MAGLDDLVSASASTWAGFYERINPEVEFHVMEGSGPEPWAPGSAWDWG